MLVGREVAAHVVPGVVPVAPVRRLRSEGLLLTLDRVHDPLHVGAGAFAFKFNEVRQDQALLNAPLRGHIAVNRRPSSGAFNSAWSCPKFVELERESARTDMQRVVYAVEREQQALGAQAADSGNWNDTWNYMRRHFAAYKVTR